MTLCYKLTLGFGLISFAVLGLGALAVVGMNSMSAMTMTMYDQALMGSIFTKDATARFFRIRENIQRAIKA